MEPVTIVADGAFGGDEIKKAAANNVTVVNTNLSGRETEDIAADFKFNDDRTRVIECPNCKTPKSCCCTKAGICVVSFHCY